MKYQTKLYCPECLKKTEFNYLIYKAGTLRCKKCNYTEKLRRVDFKGSLDNWAEVLCEKSDMNKVLKKVKKWIPKIGYQSAEPPTIVATLIMMANEELNLTDPEKLYEDLRLLIGWYWQTYDKWKEKLKPLIK